jgi:hypothetical protein
MPGGVHENMKPWEPEEDRLIIEMLSELGPRWSKIVKQLPGRTISSVRNRWQRIDKGRRLRDSGMEFKNRCQQCGEPKRGHVCFARMRPRSPAAGDESGAASTPPLPRRGASDASLAEALPSASDVELDDDLDGLGEDTLAESVGTATVGAEGSDIGVPIINRMNSGPRICRELGFEALEAAASQREETDSAETTHPAVILMASRGASERSVRSEADMVTPSRLPSLHALAPKFVA